jgi:hypothetical protein
LLTASFLLVWLERSQRERLVAAALLCLLFVCADFWRLHVERGQYYVFVSLCWAVAWALVKRQGTNSILAGIAFGLAAVLRPVSILVMLPMLALRLNRLAFACAATAGTLVLATLPFGAQRWLEFQRLVNFYARETAGLVQYHPLKPTIKVFGGYDLTVGLTSIKTANVSPVGLMQLVEKVTHIHSLRAAYIPLSNTLVLGTLLAFSYWLWRRRHHQWKPRTQVIALLLSALVADCLSPIRWGYADVLYLVPFGLVLPNIYTWLNSTRLGSWLAAVVAGGLLAGAGFGDLPGQLPTLLRALAMVTVFVGVLRHTAPTSASKPLFGKG